MIETLGFIFGAIGTFIGGLTGQIDTSHSKAQVPTDFSSTTVVQQVSTSTSTTPASTTPVGTSPYVSIQNISGPIARGSKLTVGWSSQNLPSTARVSIKLVRGTTDTVVSTLASSMLPTVNSREVTIPSTAPTSADYRILLTVTGVASTDPLSVFSVLRSNTFEIALKGVAATLSAQVNIPSGTDGKVYKGRALSVAVSSTDVPNNTTFTARLITSNNATTNVTASGRITSNAATASLNIPTTLQNGVYKVLISSTIDSRFIEAVSSTFEVVNQPTPEVVAPKVDLEAVSTSVAQNGSVIVRWNSNVTLPTTTRFVAKIVKTESNGTETQIVASASLLSTIRTTTLKVPANATPASTYKVVLAVTGIPTTNPLDSTSVLQTAPFTVTGTPVVVLEPAITSATVDNQNATKPSTVTVSWIGKDIPAKTPIAVSVVNASTSAVAIASTNTAFSVGKKALTIPNTFVDGGYSVLLKMTQGTQVITLASVPFTVTSAPVPDAQLSIFAPIANSSYIKGTPIEIKWDFLNIVATSPTTISLINTTTNAETSLVSSGLAASAKLKKINIPATVATGTYKVKVSVNPVGKSSVVRMSDTFNVTDTVVLTSSCPVVTFNRNLTVGDTGNDVVALHNFLKLKKLITGNSTGKFEPALKTALASYQTSKGIFPADGYFGSVSRATVSADCLSSGLSETLTLSVTPNASSTFTTESEIASTWTSTNIPLANTVTFKLIEVGTNKEISVLSSAQYNGSKALTTVSAGSEKIYIPRTVSAGQYKLQIETLKTDKKTKIITQSASFAVVQATRAVTYQNANCSTITFTEEPPLGVPSYEAAALSNFLIAKGFATQFTDKFFRVNDGTNGGQNIIRNGLSAFNDARKIPDGYYNPFATSTRDIINAECKNTGDKPLIVIKDLPGEQWWGVGAMPINNEGYITINWIALNTPAGELADISLKTYDTVGVTVKNIKLSDQTAELLVPVDTIKRILGGAQIELKITPKNPKVFATSSKMSKNISMQIPYVAQSSKYTFRTTVATGTVYTTNDVLTVNWVTSNIQPNESIELFLSYPGYLDKSEWQDVYLKTTVKANLGTYSFKLPKTLPHRNFKIGFVPTQVLFNRNINPGYVSYVSPEFSFNSVKNSLTPSIVTLNKADVLPNFYIDSNDGSSPFSRAIKWNYTGNVSASDKMEIYLVPKGGVLTPDRKIWEGPVSNKATDVTSQGYYQIYRYLKASSTDELLKRYPEGKYNIVLKPVVSSGVDPKSVLVSNDITLMHSRIAITGISPNPIKQGETLSVQYSLKNLPTNRTVNLMLSRSQGGGSYDWYNYKVLFKYAPVNTTGTATIAVDSVPGTYAVNIESERRSYVVCKAKDGHGVCEDENSSSYFDMNDSGYREFTVIPK